RFLVPMKAFFDTALRMVRQGRGNLTQADILAALAGLKNLQQTYDDDAQKKKLEDDKQAYDDAAKKTKVVQDLLEAGRLTSSQEDPRLTMRDHRGVFTTFAEAHQANLVYRIMQSNLYTAHEMGVCHAFCLDWFNRILFKKRQTYAQGKSGKVWNPVVA